MVGVSSLRKCAAIGLASVCLSFSVQAVERPEDPYYPPGAKTEPVYLILTPPQYLQGQTKSAAGQTWREQVIQQVNLFVPGNKSGEDRQPLPHTSWDGSISFKLEAETAENAQAIASGLQQAFSANKSADLATEVSVDGIKYPMVIRSTSNVVTDLPDKLWMYNGPDKEAGASNIKDVWKETKGRGVTVAVLDTGTISHQNFRNVAQGFDFISDPLVSQDEDLTRDSDPTDEGDYLLPSESNSGLFQPSSWHGAHVQGTIAGTQAHGFSGVAPEASILPIRVLGKGGGRDTDIIDGLAWAIGLPVGDLPINQNPARIVNMSLGGIKPSACSPRYQKIFDKAAEMGVTVLVASGNESKPSELFAPGNCKNILTISSNERAGRRAYYSNYGNNIAFSSPGGETFERFWSEKDKKYYLRETKGDGVLSSVSADEMRITKGKAHNTYVEYQGTSMATPMAAGVVALVQSYNLKLNGTFLPVGEIRKLMKQTSRPFPVSSDQGLQCDQQNCGMGLMDAKAAMDYVKALSSNRGPIVPTPDTKEPPKPVIFNGGECLSEYTIAKKLYGEERAKIMFPNQREYSGPCPK